MYYKIKDISDLYLVLPNDTPSIKLYNYSTMYTKYKQITSRNCISGLYCVFFYE